MDPECWAPWLGTMPLPFTTFLASPPPPAPFCCQDLMDARFKGMPEAAKVIASQTVLSKLVTKSQAGSQRCSCL
jgi:hypothetical protein